ncbi:hypothetical protein ES708_12941 [subsurface metagenome]
MLYGSTNKEPITNSCKVYFPFSAPRGMIRYFPFSIRSIAPLCCNLYNTFCKLFVDRLLIFNASLKVKVLPFLAKEFNRSILLIFLHNAPFVYPL